MKTKKKPSLSEKIAQINEKLEEKLKQLTGKTLR